MELSKESIAAINALTPEARELFDRLICNTTFLQVFQHIIKAREYDRGYAQFAPQWRNMSWQARRKLKNQVAALNIPEGFICDRQYGFANAEYYTAQYHFDQALQDLRHMRMQERCEEAERMAAESDPEEKGGTEL